MDDSGNDSSFSSELIGAHKIFLAGVSPVFRGMFFGPMKEKKEVIEIKETTHEAFTTMISYVYKPPGMFKVDEIFCPQKLFELLYLAERYQVGNLKRKTEDALQSLTLTQENMIFTATVAKKFEKVFDNTSTKMLMRCLKFLFDTTNGASDICALIKGTNDNFPEANLEILHELVSIGSDSLHLPGSY